MESPAAFPDSPMEQDDLPFPCKGCGEILEEGKAFELAGNRWHIDCFRCSTCNTLLDSDAHLLLLGDGSLICSNCTYSCSSCGNKIEDLAILTGDQAFCASCFRCRNCKRKIENLRYARTSQGIFCMDCHESLMQRRRKKKAGVAPKKSAPGVKLDKSLPSLPPNLNNADTLSRADEDTPGESYVERSQEVGSRRPSEPQSELDRSRSTSSPTREPDNQDNLILPSSTYRSNRHSITIAPSEPEADTGGEFLIPLAFDPSSEQQSRARPQSSSDSRPRDFFNQPKSGGSSLKSTRDGYEHLHDHPSSDSPSPHIAYQEKGRDRADIDSSRWRQDVTKATKSGSARSSRSDLPMVSLGKSTPFSAASPESTKSSALPCDPSVGEDSGAPVPPRPSHELRRLHENGSHDSTRSTSSPNTMQYPPKRGDSLESKLHHQIPRKEVGSSALQTSSTQDEWTGKKLGESPSLRGHGDASLPSRARSNSHSEQPKQHTRNNSASTYQSDSQRLPDHAGSPSLLRYDVSGDFSMDEDMARIMGSEGPRDGQNSDSFLRRVSNSVRHGRSFSDKGSRLSKDAKWPKSPNGTTLLQDMGSPNASTSEQRDEIVWLRNELRKERQRVQERDQRIAEMEAVLNASAEVKQANTELHEKRSTMVVLDAQKEIVLRELTVLTEHLEAEKRGGSNGPLDLGKLTNQALREFVEAIQKLKESYAPQIEELIHKRNTVAEELANLNRMKDKSFQEFEQLSSKNAQLAELNNQLVHQIQELYKASSPEGNRGANGLGIYSHSKEKSMTSIEDLKPAINDLTSSVSIANVQEEAEPATVLPGPQVVSIRKGQPRKFNWKKGGQNVAKGVTKGLKGAFMSSESAQEGSPGLPRSQTQGQGFGFFGNQKNKQASSKMLHNDATSAVSEGPPGLFGTDLEQRMEVEKSIIPVIVTRCIQEVELRGMDMEGIYRKSGASSVIQTIREGFEKSPQDFDISDPDLDIHAVTSSLKQYFRKLPMPLITYDIYDKIIDTNEITPTSARIEALQKSLQELPRVHRDVLEFLVFHLKRVVEREKENLMTSQNIAVVFAPTIMRPESLAREMTDVQKKNEVLKFLVENCQEIFMGMQG